MSKKISITESFNNIFSTEDKYFGEWFIEQNSSLKLFLENLQSKKLLLKQFQSLYLYLESLEILKKQSEQKDFSYAQLMSRDVWYCCVLLLLIGIIDQHTKNVLKQNGNLEKMKKRFQIVMCCLTKNDKDEFLRYYRGHNKFNTFDDVTSHLFETRNFFAHDVLIPLDSVPQDGMLAVDNDKINLMHLNMPHGRIFLFISAAIFYYLGYKGEIKIKSNKKFDNFADMLRKT